MLRGSCLSRENDGDAVRRRGAVALQTRSAIDEDSALGKTCMLICYTCSKIPTVECCPHPHSLVQSSILYYPLSFLHFDSSGYGRWGEIRL